MAVGGERIMEMETLQILQAQYHSIKECREAISALESKYKYLNEIEYFSKLVNFSTAKNIPYQRWVRYREGYSTMLVEELLKRANIEKTTHFVADPMVGSGSTIISAKQQGYDVFGVDINPFCKLIVDAKLIRPNSKDIDTIKSFLKEIINLQPYSQEINLPLSDYFPESNLRMLIALRNRIEQENNDTVKQILLAGWFFIIEDCSNRKKDGNGLATRPSRIKNVIAYFYTVMEELINDYINYPFKDSTKSAIYTGSACDFLTFSNTFEKNGQGKKLGTIIFSPPYANSFDYFESYKMELLFGQLLTPNAYPTYKNQQIRNYRICYGKELHSEFPVVELLCKEIKEEIPKKETRTGKKDFRTRLMPNMLRGYFCDMNKVLMQLYQALDENGSCYIVVDQSAYVGVIIPTDIILADIAEKVGFKVENISICRKTHTSGQQVKAYPYLSNTLRESIVCLKKS